MKFLTTTMSLFFWLLPVASLAQQKGVPDADKMQERAFSNEYYLSSDFLEKLKSGQSELSLQLIKLRLRITEMEDNHKKDSLKVLLEEEKVLSKKLVLKTSLFEVLTSTAYWPHAKRMKALNKWIAKHKEQPDKLITEGRIIDRWEQAASKEFYQYSEKDDLLSNPPGCTCGVKLSNGASDQKTTEPQLLFKQTDRNLEQYFLKRDFISGYASLRSTTAGIKIMDLAVAVASPKANIMFGAIERYAAVTIHLLNGTTVSLKNQLGTQGEWNVATQSYLYRGSYPIGIKEEKLLKNHEVDKISIRWSKAEDLYEIFELDFFINHFYCLENV